VQTAIQEIRQENSRLILYFSTAKLTVGFTMDEMLERLVSEESEKLGLPPEKFKELANIGCMIAFNDNLNSRISRFGGLDFFDEEKLRFFLLTCLEGGAASELDEN